MFLDFYRLREQPFGVTPDPRYLYFSPGHREALASLYYGLDSGRGFLGMVAEPGMGKTTLLYQLLDRLKDTFRCVFLFQTQCNSHELLRYLMSALGLEATRDLDLVDMHSQLNEFLFREAAAGRPVLLVVDEAQNLSDAVLETLRLLSNFEASNRKLIEIVLAGQPELERRLSQPALTQLRQRISILTRLLPLPASETAEYIEHRLRVAGRDGTELFSSAALKRIAALSLGIPRNINNICFNALSLGCALGRSTIGPDVVDEAAGDFALHPSVEPPQILAVDIAPARPVFSPVFNRAVASARHLRVLGTVGALAIFGSLMTYAGGGTQPGPQAPSPANPQALVSSAAASQLAASAVVPQREGPPSGQVTLPAAAAEIKQEASEFYIYVVQPHDTLRELCLWFLGNYDQSVKKKIVALNPNLKNPDHISVGQQIFFPRYPDPAEWSPEAKKRVVRKGGER